MTLLKTSACSRRKSTGNVHVSRSNNHSTDREISKLTFRQNPIHIMIQTSITDNKEIDLEQKVTAAKPTITRVSFSELPFKMMCQQDTHVTVKHISVKRKQST
ncbi:hypothetical protein I4U23_007056 [Adineta vaga]|nr:hypothetical protein I4U23_007056 [Adineta vaga]